MERKLWDARWAVVWETEPLEIPGTFILDEGLGRSMIAFRRRS